VIRLSKEEIAGFSLDHSSEENLLPDFEKPPVIEVALSVQFERLPDFKVSHYGLLWHKWKKELPKTEEHPPISPAIEEFGIPDMKKASAFIEVLEDLPMPKCWFMNDEGTRLVQLQNDRFVLNWRRMQTDEPYPHYPQLKSEFERKFGDFIQFLQENNIGT
jgi:uncharacterized protein (TIGR04255 family)